MGLRRVTWGLGLLGLLVVGGGWAGCSGSSQAPQKAVAPSSNYPDALLDKSWPIAMADDEARAPYEAASGWSALVAHRDLKGCVADLGPGGGSGAARCHLDAAAMYKQAAMLYANSIVGAWGTMADDTDPKDGAHLLTVAYILRDDLIDAKQQDARFGEPKPDDPVAAWHAPWRSWLVAGAKWPPDLSSLPIKLPPIDPATWPTVAGQTPDYTLYTQTDDPRPIKVEDLSEVVALALWHEKAARAAAQDDSPLPLYEVQYRFPIEGPVASKATLPMDYVFGSDYLVAADASFLADLLGSGGAGAVDTWKDKSLLAAIAAASRVDGKIDPEKVVDLASETRRLTLAKLKDKAGGNTEGFHRTFADIARVAVLRGVALVAEVEGNHEKSGRLRILALEGSDQEWTAEPAALLSMAAWDAGNEYPVRATDTLHNLIRRFPTLEPARFGVDVLALRVSRRRGGGLPGQ